MSYQEKMNFIESLRLAIQSYQGFTASEKAYGLKNIHNWIGANGSLEVFIQKFSDLSLDIEPFLLDKKFLKI
ncbi:MAG TPA: hypothetical protein EYM49_05845 [Campylobacterales bacterium]|nr:hypothetical protein [Campylobacterales bacterium]